MPSGSSNQFSYLYGQTNITIGTGLTVQVFPPRTCNAVVFGWQSGGSLAIVNSIGATAGTGFVLTTTERMSCDGPAGFFLAASGATAVAGVLFKYSAGYSLTP
jgi:hypothetical protein